MQTTWHQRQAGNYPGGDMLPLQALPVSGYWPGPGLTGFQPGRPIPFFLYGSAGLSALMH